MSAQRYRYLAAITGVALLVAGLFAGLPGLAGALAHLLPVLLLALALLVKGYPGERILLELRTRAHGRRAADAEEPPSTNHPRAFLPRGGRLLAFKLAVRPPPAASAPAPS